MVTFYQSSWVQIDTCACLAELLGILAGAEPGVVIRKLCDEFYIRLISDRCIMPYFRFVTMGRMRHLQRLCLTEFLGGPKVYRGVDMRTAHAHLHITNDVYDAVVGHLLATVAHLLPDAPPPLVTALLELTETLRPLIQNTDKLPALPQEFSHSDLHSGLATRYLMYFQKAAPYFTGTFWETGCFKKRAADSPHPALDTTAQRNSAACCPWLHALQRTVERKRHARVAPEAEGITRVNQRRAAETAFTPQASLGEPSQPYQTSSTTGSAHAVLRTALGEEPSIPIQ